MKKLGMLIIILLASFNLFSQTDTDSTQIRLNNKVAKLVVKELITFDALKIETELITKKVVLLEDKVVNLSSIIDTQKGLLTNYSSIFTELETQNILTKNINEGLKLDLKKANRKAGFWKITAGIVGVVGGTLLITK